VAYLVKPLDVGQIVPTVEAAFERLRNQRSDAAQRPPRASAAAASHDVVTLAAGVLMHRYSLSRSVAFERLQRLADDADVSLVQQAERLVAAVEELARPAAL
jgi:response regulator NasT